jgi:hypothetical protein
MPVPEPGWGVRDEAMPSAISAITAPLAVLRFGKARSNGRLPPGGLSGSGALEREAGLRLYTWLTVEMLQSAVNGEFQIFPVL